MNFRSCIRRSWFVSETTWASVCSDPPTDFCVRLDKKEGEKVKELQKEGSVAETSLKCFYWVCAKWIPARPAASRARWVASSSGLTQACCFHVDRSDRTRRLKNLRTSQHDEQTDVSGFLFWFAVCRRKMSLCFTLDMFYISVNLLLKFCMNWFCWS